MFINNKQPLLDSNKVSHSRWHYISLIFLLALIVGLYSWNQETSETSLGVGEGGKVPVKAESPPPVPEADPSISSAQSGEAGPSGLPPPIRDIESAIYSDPDAEAPATNSVVKITATIEVSILPNKHACRRVNELICRQAQNLVRDPRRIMCKWDELGMCANPTKKRIQAASKIGPQVTEKLYVEFLIAFENPEATETTKAGIVSGFQQFKSSNGKIDKVDVQSVQPYSPAMCSDPVKGFVRTQGSCGQFYFHSKQYPHYNAVRLTKDEWQILYLVSDLTSQCEDDECSERDTETCCKLSPRCNNAFLKDVPEGCPENKVVNPYMGAYCRTFPCTSADAAMCCIAQTGELFERTDFFRSKYARAEPDLKAPIVKPRIDFGRREIAWIKMNEKVAVGNDEYAPLVNFMEHWGVTGGEGVDSRNTLSGMNVGWQTPAWIRVSQKGKMLYKPLSAEKMSSTRSRGSSGIEMSSVQGSQSGNTQPSQVDVVGARSGSSPGRK